MVKVCLNDSARWFTDRVSGHVRGWAFDGGVMLKGGALLGALALALRQGCLDATLQRLNGSFSAVLSDGDGVCLIADKLKSWPLLYFRDEDSGGWAVCDDGNEAVRMMGGCELDANMLPTFLSLGYLWGENTLCQRCRMVAAGTFVRLDSVAASSHVYSRPVARNLDADATTIFGMASVALEDAFSRALELAGHRTIAIPLSGGYDSRLLACLCKMSGHGNVVCFTYGDAANPEVEVSRRVAGELGFPWFYVEYAYDKWQRFVCSGRLEEYLLHAGNLNAIGHIQDFIAIDELMANGAIPPDAVVMPGHTGDVLGGSHLPGRCGSGNVAQLIYDKYYELNVLKRPCKAQAMRMLRGALPAVLHGEEECLQAFYCWGKSSRQSNFIINSVRAYDQAGLDWALPLWDDAYASVWEAVPCLRLRGSALYDSFMFDRYFKPMGLAFAKPSLRRGLASRVLSRVMSHDLRTLVKHFMGRVGIVAGHEGSYDMNVVGNLIREHYVLPQDIIDDYVRFVRPGSMSAKALLYLALLR